MSASPSADAPSLLEQLARGGAGDPWSSLAAKAPQHNSRQATIEDGATEGDEALDGMLGRLNALAQGEPLDKTAPMMEMVDKAASEILNEAANSFIPQEPHSFREASLTESEVSSLALKYLLSRGEATGRDVADQVKLPFMLIERLLANMKQERLIVHKGAGAMNDYVYEMTDLGRERARRLAEHCTYFGSAPVDLSDYIASIKLQSLTEQHPTTDDLRRAFSDLLINPNMLRRLGPAINSGRGLFLFGRRATAKRASPSASPARLGRRFGFRGRSASTAKSSACSTPATTRKCRCLSTRGCCTRQKSTSAGSAFAGRRLSSAAS